jgi:gliding motility-associated-like protein
MLVVRGSSVCTDTVRSMIVITEEGVIEMPNVFSPNGDGQNDAFIPLGYTGTPGQLTIYNRWGQELFTTSALARGWDGRASGTTVPEGTYYYIVKPLEGPSRSGHVTLTR